MSGSVEVEWLRQAIELCSRSAVAYKAAFMLDPAPRLERRLLDRCTDRYALLERLLGFLLDQGMAAERMRAMLERLDTDPARYGRLESALDEARACDRELARMTDRALAGDLRLPKALEIYLAGKRADLEALEPAGGQPVPMGKASEPILPVAVAITAGSC